MGVVAELPDMTISNAKTESLSTTSMIVGITEVWILKSLKTTFRQLFKLKSTDLVKLEINMFGVSAKNWLTETLCFKEFFSVNSRITGPVD